MVALEEAGRIDHVSALDRVENVAHSHAGAEQFCGIRFDVELGLLAALHDYGRNAVQAVQPRLDFVSRHFPELSLRHRIRCEAVAHDGKGGEGHAARVDAYGCRKRRLHAGNGGVDTLQRLEHVHIPVEAEVNFGRASAGGGTDFFKSGQAINGFFDGASDHDHHLVDWHHSGFDRQYHSGKVRVGE